MEMEMSLEHSNTIDNFKFRNSAYRSTKEGRK